MRLGRVPQQMSLKDGVSELLVTPYGDEDDRPVVALDIWEHNEFKVSILNRDRVEQLSDWLRAWLEANP